MAALSATVLLIVLPLILGRGEGWPAWTGVCLAAGLPAFWLFLRIERRTAAGGGDPLVDTGVVGRPAILLGLVAMLTATGTYYALLFTLAQYLQHGLGRSPLVSGLFLVPWVTAFGLAGQITRRLPARLRPLLPVTGYLLLAAAYLAIGVALSTGRPGDVVLVVLLGLGGLGLGTGFATLLGHLTAAVRTDYASQISGVITTTLQIGGAMCVAGFGSLYLALATIPGEAGARHAFATTSLALGATALIAAAMAYLTTHVPASAGSARRAKSSRTRASVAWSD